MEIKFINPGFDYMIEKILAFQTEESSGFWQNPLYYFYPQLDKEYTSSLSLPEKKRHIADTLKDIYVQTESVINEKTVLYFRHWQNCRSQISAALSDAFETDCDLLFNDMKCNISMNPIEPRFLREHSFDIFYLNSERGAIGESIHEIIHFIWFYVWNQLFHDSYEEYENPSLKWILSEMVVESIMKDTRLSSINPYFKREDGGCIYPYFFDMKANGRFVLSTIDEMYHNRNIASFMQDSYAYCLKHEAEIRMHIRQSEQTH